MIKWETDNFPRLEFRQISNSPRMFNIENKVFGRLKKWNQTKKSPTHCATVYSARVLSYDCGRWSAGDKGSGEFEFPRP